MRGINVTWNRKGTYLKLDEYYVKGVCLSDPYPLITTKTSWSYVGGPDKAVRAEVSSQTCIIVKDKSGKLWTDVPVDELTLR